MNTQLNRLQAFLADAGELEIVAPAAARRPDYFGRCARLLGGALLATQITAVAAPAPAPAQADVPIAIAPTLAAVEDPATRAGIASVKAISSRYLSHGRSPLTLAVTMLDTAESPEEGPTATIAPNNVCLVEAVRADYSKSDPRLARMADTPAMRALVLVHESMHCRIGLALVRHAAERPAPLSMAFLGTFNESSADAFALLTLARRDGIPVALNALDRLAEIRAAEAASPEADGSHDSRETLRRIRALLVETPEKLASDGAILSLAVTEALHGTSVTFKNALPAQQQGYMATAEFSADMARFHATVEEIGKGYLEGKHDLGHPVIGLKNTLLNDQSGSVPGDGQFLAKRSAPPPFTAASLRSEAETITTSVIAAAAGAKPIVAASAPAPAAQASGMLAIGRLRSRLDSIYVGAAGEAEHQHETAQFEESDRPGQ